MAQRWSPFLGSPTEGLGCGSGVEPLPITCKAEFYPQQSKTRKGSQYISHRPMSHKRQLPFPVLPGHVEAGWPAPS